MDWHEEQCPTRRRTNSVMYGQDPPTQSPECGLLDSHTDEGRYKLGLRKLFLWKTYFISSHSSEVDHGVMRHIYTRCCSVDYCWCNECWICNPCSSVHVYLTASIYIDSPLHWACRMHCTGDCTLSSTPTHPLRIMATLDLDCTEEESSVQCLQHQDMDFVPTQCVEIINFTTNHRYSSNKTKRKLNINRQCCFFEWLMSNVGWCVKYAILLRVM